MRKQTETDMKIYRKKRRKAAGNAHLQKKNVLFVLLCILAVISGLQYLTSFGSSILECLSESVQTGYMAFSSAYDRKSRNEGTSVSGAFVKQCCEIYETSKELLVLVNKEYAIPEDYEVSLRSLNDSDVEVAEVLYEDLKEMLSDACEEGAYSYYFVSGKKARSRSTGTMSGLRK